MDQVCYLNFGWNPLSEQPMTKFHKWNVSCCPNNPQSLNSGWASTLTHSVPHLFPNWVRDEHLAPVLCAGGGCVCVCVSESIECIEDQAFLRSYYSAPRPPPSSLFRWKLVSLSHSACMSPGQLTEGRGGQGEGEEPNHTTTRKLGPL